MSNGPDLMTAQEVALLLRVHPNTVMTWAKQGKLAGLKMNGGRWRFHRSDIEKFLQPVREGS